MIVREACPACGSERFKRNGHVHTGQQNHQCKACGRQFVLHADNHQGCSITCITLPVPLPLGELILKEATEHVWHWRMAW